MADRRLLLVHAHPDDETIGTGATMAKYAAEGAHVTLVTCTLGEEGEVIPPELANLSGDSLGQHRIGELAAACAALGVTDHRFLGGAGRWRDSGMMGTPQNDRGGCFWRADLDEATRALVAVVREVRPQVVVTYDARGGYGHPDHIQAHRVTLAAVAASADQSYGGGAPWEVAKLYFTATPRSALQAGIDRLPATGRFARPASPDELPFGNADEEVSTEIDARAYLPAKLAAMRAHATQITVEEPFFALSDNVGHLASGTEHYVLAGPRRARTGGRESCLFGRGE
jgi:N-acetyl-1-D-myo-inositol-2-amino-2-deoxy-alpha-D-glucopyranoside deacetylase